MTSILEILNFFVSPITELCKCLIPPLKRHICYIVCCRKNFKQLKEKVEELERTRNDVQARVDAAKRNLESIHEAVEAWLEKVGKATSRDGDQDQSVNILELVMNDEAVNRINTKCWCSCGSGSRYNLGKKTAKKMVIIDQLMNEGKGFGDSTVSKPYLPGRDLPHTNNQEDFEYFASREHLWGEVMEALQDEGTNIIVVHGMGGVGKTTLVNQVYEQEKKKKNLFQEVVKATVSRNVIMEKLQNDIADMLDLKQMKSTDNAFQRAELLAERLKQKRTLVILDDLWSPLNFSDVGIPCRENGCKVIITTRKLDACTMFGITKKINVAELSEEDSWKLFKKNVGDLADSYVLETTARKIAKECKGLPVALVTLGRTLLRNKNNPSVWDNILHELKTSNITDIEGMDSNVYSSIKLSYDYLGNEKLKKCFLLCCLYPEDHRICVPELMAYMMDDDKMFDEEETMKQRRDRVKAILEKLVDSCLLLREKYYNTYVVSMHDVIRDVAINIASQEGNGFLVKAGVGLKRWTETGKTLPSSSSGTGQSLRRLSLMRNEITVLPNDHSHELPHLLSLSLYANESLKEIPDSFFQKMVSLATLDLRFTGISSLPSSLSLLLNLKTLYLDGCEFHRPTNISIIGKLPKLEILSLVDCGLDGLPEEIRELTNLRLLDLESYDVCIDFTIPKNVISSLTRLEYLNMRGCKIKWEVEGHKNENHATLAEVASLPFLSGLILDFSNDVNVENLHIYFSDASDILLHSNAHVEPSICRASISPPVCYSIRVLIQRVEFLELNKCAGLKRVGQLGDEFKKLRILHIERCNELEYVMSLEESEIPKPFLALERLKLSELDRFKMIFVGLVPTRFIDRLSSLAIDNCHEMVNIFDTNLGKRVPNLVSLSVWDCDRLKDVFNLELEIGSSTLNIEEAGPSDVTFSRLREMTLNRLPILENIWKGYIPPVGCFENLEEMRVCSCPNLKCLFSTSMARNLQNLKQLEILNCSRMVKLIAAERIMVYNEDVDDQLPLKIFPNLKKLEIWNCQNLKQLWDGKNLEMKEVDQLAMMGRASILDFPYLEYLTMVRCKNLKRIRLTHQCTQQLKKIVGDSEEWFNEGLEWENPTDKRNMGALFFHGELYTGRSMEIISDHYMVSVFSLNLVTRLPYLKSLYVATCDGLKDVFNLGELIGTSTLNIKEALSDFTFSELEKLKLHHLPILENIWKGYIPSVGCFENLKRMEVWGCHKLSYLLSQSIARNLQNLQLLNIRNCNSMVKLIASDKEGQQTSFKIFPKLIDLTIVSCENLKHLWDTGMNLAKKENDDADDQLVMGRTSILDFPYLQYLEVHDCENLKRIFLTHQCTQQLKYIGGDSEEWFEGLEWENPTDKLHMRTLFKELRSLNIISAQNMVTVFNLNLVKRVPDPEILKVIDCVRLKNVFSLEETGTSLNIEVALSEFTFSKLRVMLLENLPILENIWKGYIPSVRCFENLGAIFVYKCKKLRYLFSLSMAKNLQNLEKLYIDNCESMVKLIASEGIMVYHDNVEDQLLQKIFPILKRLEIIGCENLKQLWDIGQNLGKENGDAATDDDDQLAITGRSSILDFSYLEYLKVLWCENLKKIHLTHRCTYQLKEIYGDDEEWFQGLEWENPIDKLSMHPFFKEWKYVQK